jgi:hypothetical protein
MATNALTIIVCHNVRKTGKEIAQKAAKARWAKK